MFWQLAIKWLRQKEEKTSQRKPQRPTIWWTSITALTISIKFVMILATRLPCNTSSSFPLLRSSSAPPLLFFSPPSPFHHFVWRITLTLFLFSLSLSDHSWDFRFLQHRLWPPSRSEITCQCLTPFPPSFLCIWVTICIKSSWRQKKSSDSWGWRMESFWPNTNLEKKRVRLYQSDLFWPCVDHQNSQWTGEENVGMRSKIERKGRGECRLYFPFPTTAFVSISK